MKCEICGKDTYDIICYDCWKELNNNTSKNQKCYICNHKTEEFNLICEKDRKKYSSNLEWIKTIDNSEAIIFTYKNLYNYIIQHDYNEELIVELNEIAQFYNEQFDNSLCLILINDIKEIKENFENKNFNKLYYYTESIKTKSIRNNKCVFCDNELYYNFHLFCRDCYYKLNTNINIKRSKYNDYLCIKNYFILLKSIKNKIKEEKYLQLNELKQDIYDLYSYSHEQESYCLNNDLPNRIEIDVYNILTYNNILGKLKNDSMTSIESIIENDNNEIYDSRKKYGENSIRADDGHYVRSNGELTIDNWLFYNNIPHAYEKKVFLTDYESEELTPDFYIPEVKTYIEFWGMEGKKDYDEIKEKKLKAYEENNIKIINLYKKDLKTLDDILRKQLKKHGLNL